MSTAPSETGCFDSFAANLQDETEPAASTQHSTGAKAALAAPPAYEAHAARGVTLTDGLHIHRPTNLPLGVFDLSLRFKDDTPIRGNKIPLHDEMPVLFTVRFTNKPEGVNDMVMNVIISELGKGGSMKGGSGSYTKYVRSMTYEDTVPIMSHGPGSYSITIEVGHAAAPSGGFHGGDGPYDVYVSFAPATPTGTHKAMSGAAENDDDDEYGDSQIEETLRYTFYNPKTHFLARLYYAVWRFWDGL